MKRKDIINQCGILHKTSWLRRCIALDLTSQVLNNKFLALYKGTKRPQHNFNIMNKNGG